MASSESTSGVLPASVWLAALDRPGGALRSNLLNTYGNHTAVLSDRVRLIRAALTMYLERFGDDSVRITRSPGRINLRGMHVDTHGGFLNLMTHQREVVAISAPDDAGRVYLTNCDPHYHEVVFNAKQEVLPEPGSNPQDAWLHYITSPEALSRIASKRGDWELYLQGAIQRVRFICPGEHFVGLRGVIASDLPSGAALSSSHALCASVMAAVLAWNQRVLDERELILAIRDAEWYTGARSGVSDQAAMVLGRSGVLVHTALYAPALEVDSVQRLPFPQELRVLVVNSHTRRSLSGAALAAYARNRFAYSLAMHVFRDCMHAEGLPHDLIEHTDRLCRISPEAFVDVGGLATLYALLRAVPESLTIEQLRLRLGDELFQAAWDQYFGTAPEALRPNHIDLRGPLMFGVAESERARLFFRLMTDGNYQTAGHLMSTGHDGDRRVTSEGHPFVCDVSDAAIVRRAACNLPVHECPGVYGASTPALDDLVDTALNAGALGASLTGAGIAGSILALCHGEDADSVADALRSRLATPDYAWHAGLDAPVSPDEAHESVVENTATAPAGAIFP